MSKGNVEIHSSSLKIKIMNLYKPGIIPHYVIYELKEKKVHTPSTDYYARSGDSEISDITTLQELYIEHENKFDSIDEATSYLKNITTQLRIFPNLIFE
jgi:uncharacterized membrane protein YjjP (DUF1212 family)